LSYTIETPKPFPIEARVKAHIAAVEALMNVLKGKINPLLSSGLTHNISQRVLI
jgi:hypothetical protein